MSRTAPLTSKRCILYISSTNVGTEYFKHAVYSPFFFSSKCSLFQNANLFGSCIIHILYTECAKIKKKKNNSGAKGLKDITVYAQGVMITANVTEHPPISVGAYRCLRRPHLRLVINIKIVIVFQVNITACSTKVFVVSCPPLIVHSNFKVS